MTNTTHPLWHRLSEFQLDEPGVSLPYSKRLAQENRWSQEFTDRVVEEYKKFLFLATTSHQPVTPSKAVDQAWHLHLTYSRCYWDVLCAHVLQRPLHHDPTTGGQDESEKYSGQYRDALAQYEAVFGSPPPDDIWGRPLDQHQAATRVPGWDVAARLSALVFQRGRAEVLVALIVVVLIVSVGLAHATEDMTGDSRPWFESLATVFGWHASDAGVFSMITVGIAFCAVIVVLLLHFSVPRSSRKRRRSHGSCGGCSGGPSCGSSGSGGSSCGGGGCGGGD